MRLRPRCDTSDKEPFLLQPLPAPGRGWDPNAAFAPGFLGAQWESPGVAGPEGLTRPVHTPANNRACRDRPLGFGAAGLTGSQDTGRGGFSASPAAPVLCDMGPTVELL